MGLTGLEAIDFLKALGSGYDGADNNEVAENAACEELFRIITEGGTGTLYQTDAEGNTPLHIIIMEKGLRERFRILMVTRLLEACKVR